MIMDGKSIAEMFMDQLNTNKGLYGVSSFMNDNYDAIKFRKRYRN